MSTNAPLGTDWLTWHFQRIYNYSEYLKINGYFSNFGFSIWNKCEDCSLSSDNWINRVYLTVNIFSYSPYVLINNFFGSSNLKLYGPFVDKSIIFLAGCLISELLIKLSTKKNNKSYNFIKAVLCFTFFIVNPWTYKMLIGSWWFIFFQTFFLLGISMFSIKKNKLGLFSFFIAGCFDYQSAAGVALFYILLLAVFSFQNKHYLNKEYFPKIVDNKLINYKHAKSGYGYIRAVDEYPQEIFARLQDSGMTFKSLPGFKADPKDEQSVEFQSALVVFMKPMLLFFQIFVEVRIVFLFGSIMMIKLNS